MEINILQINSETHPDLKHEAADIKDFQMLQK